MPIYEYKCLHCGKHHEIMCKITDRPLSKCPDCSGKMKKMISNTSFVLKGTGWYATDYASDKSKKDKEKGSGKAPKAEGTKTETNKNTKTEDKKDTTTETKTETKKETKTENKPVSKETTVQK